MELRIMAGWMNAIHSCFFLLSIHIHVSNHPCNRSSTINMDSVLPFIQSYSHIHGLIHPSIHLSILHLSMVHFSEGWIFGRMVQSMDEQAIEWMEEPHLWLGWVSDSMDGWIHGCGWIEGRLRSGMDGWFNPWMDERLNGWKNRIHGYGG